MKIETNLIAALIRHNATEIISEYNGTPDKPGKDIAPKQKKIIKKRRSGRPPQNIRT